MAFLFTHHLHTSIQINAPPDLVRRVLLDFPSYPEWCTAQFKTIEVIDGKGVSAPMPKDAILACSPEELKIRFELWDGGVFYPKPAINTPTEFAWRWSLPYTRFIFDAMHSFQFKASGANNESTEFIQSESFAGLLSGASKVTSTGETIEKRFREYNEVFKKRCEELAAMARSR